METELLFQTAPTAKAEVKEAKQWEEHTWKGSINTLSMVAHQIAERFGDKAVRNYDPDANCFTYSTWKAKGFHVKKGEKAIKSITWIPISKKDKTTGEETETRCMRTVNLFYISQVEKD